MNSFTEHDFDGVDFCKQHRPNLIIAAKHILILFEEMKEILAKINGQ